jgi:mono/diheme cytochrome c family protein
MTMRAGRRLRRPSLFALGASAVLTLSSGCDRLDMYDQPRYKPLAASNFFADGLSARPRVDGVVARGELRDDGSFYTGKEGQAPVSEIPAAAYRAIQENESRQNDQAMDPAESVELRRALLTRGRERFDIYCSVCHSRTGDGNGMIVRRGFPKPPSLHIERLREAPAGHFFDVMTHGLGAMPSYAGRIDVGDRWAIVAYVRALQLSHNARVEDVPDKQRSGLSAARSSDAEGQP